MFSHIFYLETHKMSHKSAQQNFVTIKSKVYEPNIENEKMEFNTNLLNSPPSQSRKLIGICYDYQCRNFCKQSGFKDGHCLINDCKCT